MAARSIRTEGSAHPVLGSFKQNTPLRAVNE
jgi:hypothetical protein